MSKDDVVIECSWNLDVDQVREKIIWKTGEQGELTEEADAENCFTISSNPSSAEAEPCTLKFLLSNNRKFSSLHVLSEVLHISALYLILNKSIIFFLNRCQ